MIGTLAMTLLISGSLAGLQRASAPRGLQAVGQDPSRAGALTLHGPGFTSTVTARTRTPLSGGRSSWVGVADDDPATTAAFVFGSEGADGALMGVVRRGDEAWQVTSDRGQALRWSPIDTASLPACGLGAAQRIAHPAQNGPALDDSSWNAQAPPNAGMRTVVDVLVVYTPAARLGEGGTAAIETLIDLAAAEGNLAYELSGLNLVVRVAHTAETNYVESGNHSLDMQRLQTKQDGHMDEVFGLRNTYGADCVMLVTDTLNTCGNGYLWFDPPNPGFKAFAFSVVSRHCAVSNLTFAHELGHNMGCDHDLANASPTGGAYGYSRGFVTPSGNWRTVMGLSAATRIPRFSDPNATWQGEVIGSPTGQAGAAHNVQSLGNVAPLVSTFRKPKPQAIGTGMTTSAGTTVALAIDGSNDTNLSDFGLDVSGGVPSRPAIAFVGFEPGVIPFAGGTLWITPPLMRLGVTTLDGNGATSYDPLSLPPFVAGQEAFFQTWTSDPSNPSGSGVALSNSIRVEFF